MKKFRLAILLPITSMLLSGCVITDFFKNLFGIKEEKKEEEKESVNVTDIVRLTINGTGKINVKAGSTITEIKTISYVSNNPAIATIKDNVVTGVSIGQTTISVTVKTKSGLTFNKECRVVVSAEGKTNLKYTYDDYNTYNVYPLDNCPLVGKPKLLIIPIWFADSYQFINPTKKEQVRDDIRKTMLGSNKETGWRSVKTYYEEESFGKVKLTGTVTEWYETSKSYEAFLSSSVSTSICTAAVSAYFKEHTSETRKDYDTNGDGYLDAVVFVYAAPDCQNLGYSETNNLWAYTSWMMEEPNKTNPTMNVYFWGSYDFMYTYGAYAKSRTGSSVYGRGDCDNCVVDAHCYIHEFGHVLGLPDYYDYSGQRSPAGGFSMQDCNVGGHDPYSVLAYGWVQAYIPTETTTLKINDFQSSHDVILLANHTVDSPFDEYILVELYSPTDLNKFDTDSCYLGRYPMGSEDYGIRLWHVDGRLISYYFDYSSYQWKMRENLTSNPKTGYVYQAMSNTYYDSATDNTGSISPLGVDYANYNVLELLRSDNSSEDLNNNNLFSKNMSFDMNTYSSQFVNGLNMNDGQPLGWSFRVEDISNGTATITVTKN